MPTDTQREPTEAELAICEEDVRVTVGQVKAYLSEGEALAARRALIIAIAKRVREAEARPLSVPSTLNPDYVVTIARDGDMHCALCGPNLQEGTAGFGPSIPDALYDLADQWEAPHA